jgi:uncharacterized membrane protein
MMSRKAMMWASLVVVAALAAVAFAVGTSLPEGVQLPTHWGWDGKADKFSDKWTALLMPVAIAAGVSLLFVLLPAIEPRRKGMERSQGLYFAGWAGVLLLACLIELAVVAAARGWKISATTLILAGVGALFVLLGNQMSKTRSTYTIGIRTPWTLASEEVWMKTHRLGAKLFVAGGLVMLIAALADIPASLLNDVVLGVAAVTAAIPVAYSYLLWRRESAGGQPKA